MKLTTQATTIDIQLTDFVWACVTFIELMKMMMLLLFFYN